MSAQKRSAAGAIGGFLGFIGMSVVAGVLVAASITPALAVTGVTANSTIGIFDDLPEYLAIGDLAQKSTIYAKNAEGKDVFLASFYAQNREEVSWNEVAQSVKDAAVAGEDQRFYEHGGVDLIGTLRAIGVVVGKGGLQGGSSITQQYVKNVLVQKAEANPDPVEAQKEYEEATEVSPDRKLKEMKLAIGLEKSYSKDQILLGYLNITGFGGQVYGIQSAAKYYYGVSAKNLTNAQAASLIAIVNSPNNLRLDEPDNPDNGEANGYKANRERRDWILGQMLKEKKITKAEYQEAIDTPIEPKITPSTTGCQAAGGSAYFCDAVTYALRNDPAFGSDEEARWANFQRGGYKIYTTLNLPAQLAAEKAIKENVPPTVKWGNMGTASVAVEAGTGRVLAMAQNTKYSQDPDQLNSSKKYSPINFSTDKDAGQSSGFQAGSTYKVFTLAEWLKEGHPLQESFNGRIRPISFFRDSCNGNWYNPDEPYQTANDDYRLAFNAIDATKYSVNSAFMAMAEKMDLCQIKRTAQDFGVHRADGHPLGWTEKYPDVPADGVMYPSDVIGTQEVAPLTMAAAFAGIANKGVFCTPIYIDKIFDSSGKELTPPKSKCTEAVSPKVAAAMAYAMKTTFEGDGTAVASNPYDGIQHIGKTGTTDNAVHTWMIGASTKAALATWVGNVSGSANQREESFPISSTDSYGAATARHRMWKPIMAAIDEQLGGDDFPSVDTKLLYGVQVQVPDVRGKSLSDAKAMLESLGFSWDERGKADSELPKGQIARTEPAGGTMATKGAIVDLYTSRGNLSLVPDVTHFSEQDARAALSQFDVRVKSTGVDDPALDGLVVSMDPGPGNGLKSGKRVTITIGKYSGPPAGPPGGEPGNPGQGPDNPGNPGNG